MQVGFPSPTSSVFSYPQPLSRLRGRTGACSPTLGRHVARARSIGLRLELNPGASVCEAAALWPLSWPESAADLASCWPSPHYPPYPSQNDWFWFVIFEVEENGRIGCDEHCRQELPRLQGTRPQAETTVAAI